MKDKGNKDIVSKVMYILIPSVFTIFIIILAVVYLRCPSNFTNLASLALIAVTAIYACATIMLLVENRRTIREMKQARLDIVKPALSLQPEGFDLGGGFGPLCLMNSGGVAKDVKIDIEVTNPDSKEVLFVPAINRGHKVYLKVSGEVQDKGGRIEVKLKFKDSYDQDLTESLSIDFSELKKEGRKIWGQYSELDGIKRVLERIEHKVK